MTQLPVVGAATTQAGGHLLRGHARIATLLASTRAEATRILGSIRPGPADAVEVRLDGLWPKVPDEEEAIEDLLAITSAAPAGIPLIATLRPVRQGGRFQGAEEVRVGLLAAAARAGFAAVDIEADLADTAPVLPALRKDAACILSHHDLQVPTCDDGGTLLLSMQDRGAELDKLAFQAGAFPDTLRALELTRKHAARGGRPAISTTSMGGAPLRALLALAGNRATYGHADGAPPAAPGQPALSEVQALWDHWGLGKDDLDATAEAPAPWFAVLGMPVLHSLSPRLLNAALHAGGRRERYGAMEVPASASALRLVCIIARRIGLHGASVTAPHKTDAARMGRNDAVAQAVGAANCLRFGEGEPEATNTDATALRRILAPHVRSGEPAVVIGAGGAARAALWALRDIGAKARFTSRDESRARKVAADLAAEWVPWDRRGELSGAAWVQAASLDASAPSPVPASQLRGTAVAVELNYKDGPTPFGRAAAEAGCAMVDGQRMLLEQAVDAYRFWFGQEADRTAMSAALRGRPA